MRQKQLLINGGMRVGDTFHLIPYFEENLDKEIDWVVGSYERQAAELIQYMYPNIKNLFIEKDGVPGNLEDRNAFKKNYYLKYKSDKYDEIESGQCVSFDSAPLRYQLKSCYSWVDKFPRDVIENYIVYHLDTISDWKRHNKIRNFKIKFPSYSIGCSGDFLHPDSKDFRGEPLIEVAKLICKSRFLVGIHSAMACLAFYLNTPTIVIHPLDGLMKFSDYRHNWVDAIIPETETLEQAIKNKLSGL